jgi:uncharacterized protein YfdQ (DUF2303 family)
VTDEIKADMAEVLDRFAQLSGSSSITLNHPNGDDFAPEARAMILPEGLAIHSLRPFINEWLERPERREGTARLDTLDSFIAHTIRFRSADSVVYADASNPLEPKLTSVLDYHPAGATSAPAWCKHRGVYAFPLSDEWKMWARVNAFDNQAAFAAFLEDRLVDVVDPESVKSERVAQFAEGLGITLATPSQLLTLSRGLEVTVGQKVVNNVNLSSGERTLQFSEEHVDKAGQKLKVPGGFVVAIPVFEGDAIYPVPVRLRYTVSGGAVRWTLQPQRADLVFRDAFNRACALVAEKTSLPVLRGAAEHS